MDNNNAFSTSLVTCCLIKAIAYSTSSASHGNVRCPLLEYATKWPFKVAGHVYLRPTTNPTRWSIAVVSSLHSGL
ncbi:hypothetical protein BDE02_07G107800 [Populus trichocarpa]|nr:hypothetical protein BDE02_07G107800 [Populus trichocarpa]